MRTLDDILKDLTEQTYSAQINTITQEPWSDENKDEKAQVMNEICLDLLEHSKRVLDWAMNTQTSIGLSVLEVNIRIGVLQSQLSVYEGLRTTIDYGIEEEITYEWVNEHIQTIAKEISDLIDELDNYKMLDTAAEEL